jgi:hypothetical protein
LEVITMHSLFHRPAILIIGCVIALGCAQETEIVAAQAAIPDTPDGTVVAVAQNMADNHPEILWEALPESYRADITEITRLFAAKMDPEIYDRAMAIALSFVDTLDAKQDIILASNTVTGTGVDIAEVEARMTPALGIARTLLSSETSTLAGLAAIDWQQYLAGTVAQVMAQADAIEPVEGEDPFLMFESLQVEVLEQSGDTARLRVTAGDEEPEEVTLALIENRWVPVEMAEQWDAKVAEIRTNLEEITPEKMQELKGQAMFGFAMAEGIVQQLAAIETSEEFDATMGPMIAGLMQNIGNFMPDAEEIDEPETETP